MGQLVYIVKPNLSGSHAHYLSAVQMVNCSVFHSLPCLTITLPPPLPSAPSAPPQEVHLLSLSSTSIKVSWVALPKDSHHGEIVRYSLAYQALTGDNVECHQVTGIGADVTSYVLEELEKWTEYLVWVRAHTDVGPSPESLTARIRTKEDGMLMMSCQGDTWASLEILII